MLTISQLALSSYLPGTAVIADSKQRYGSHEDGIHPSHHHDPQGSSVANSFGQVHGVSDGEPSFDCDNCQSEDGELACEDCQEACNLAPHS